MHMDGLLTKAELLPRGDFSCVHDAILRRRDLTLAAKVVYIAMLNHLRGDALIVRPSMKHLAEMCAISRRVVHDAIHGPKGLVQSGIIRCFPTRGRTPSQYGFLSPLGTPIQIPATGQKPARNAAESAALEREIAAQRGRFCRVGTQNRQRNTADSAALTRQNLRPKQDGQGNGNNNKAVVGFSENSYLQENADAFRQIGITQKSVIAKLAATPGVTALKIVLLALQAKENPAGYVRQRIESGAIEPKRNWTAQHVCRAIQRGWLLALDGHRFDEPGVEVKPFTQGLVIKKNDEKVGKISIARLRELAGQTRTDAERRTQGHKRAEEHAAEDQAKRDDAILAMRRAIETAFASLPAKQRKKCIRQAEKDCKANASDAIVIGRAIQLAYNAGVLEAGVAATLNQE